MGSSNNRHADPHSYTHKRITTYTFQVLTLVSTTVAAAQDESTPASTTASHASSHAHSSSSDELLAPTTDSSLYIIDELNRAVPGLEVHNSLEDSFLPPPTAASLVGSPPGLDESESRTLSPGFKVRPRGHSAPVSVNKNWEDAFIACP